MPKNILPDAAEPLPPTPPPARPSPAVPTWTVRDLEAWLSTASLADWARDWLRSLRPRFGEAWPLLVATGLGAERRVPPWMAPGSPDAVWLRQYLERSELAHAWFEGHFLAPDPVWLERLLRYEHAKVARSFLLSGNITDYAFDPVRGYRPAVRLLVEALMRTKDCVLSYRLSQGLVLHSRDGNVKGRLPEAIRQQLGAGGFHDDLPLLSQVCRLFDVLGRWLTGSPPAGEDEPDSYELPRGVGIVFENVHLLIPPDRGNVERNFLVDNLLHWSISPELFRSSHCLILMAESLEDVGNELRARGGKIEQMTIPRPGTARERLKFLLPLLDPGSRMTETRVARLPQGRSWLSGYGQGSYGERLHQLSHDTAGLSFLGIEDLLQQVSAAPDGRLSRGAVMRLKRDHLRQESGGLLEVLDPQRSLGSIGGYATLKRRLAEIIRALRGSQEALVRSTVPMGILFFGPPGTGKSITAEALAGESGISMARLGDFRGMYVGESERNLSRILSLIEALHPVIVFIDEIDQVLGKRDTSAGDGGVDSRIFGRLLEFMSDSDHRGKILWIGASNFPDKLDPALKRAGRFDLTLPFLLPDRESRREILEVLLRSKLAEAEASEHRLSAEDFDRLAGQTEGMSGAELAAIIGEVLRRLAQTRLETRNACTIDVRLFEQILAAYRPPQGVRESYRQMEEMAVEEVSFLDLLPVRYQQGCAASGGGKP